MRGKVFIAILVFAVTNCNCAFAKIAPDDEMPKPDSTFTETPTEEMGLPIMFCKDAEGAYAAFIGSSTCQHFDNIPLEKLGGFVMIYNKEKNAVLFLPIEGE